MSGQESRRNFLGGLFSGAGEIVAKRIPKIPDLVNLPSPEPTAPPSIPSGSFLKILRPPDSVRVFGEDETQSLDELRGGLWTGEGVSVRTSISAYSMRVLLTAEGFNPCRIAIRWQGNVTGVRRYLGDHFERSYGDLEWRAESAHRPLPWYFLAWDGKKTHAYGVKTRPNAFCFWTADAEGITLWMDVRNGGNGVQLNGRELEVCEIVQTEGEEGQSPFVSHVNFCQKMCAYPRMPDHPVYGTNDWYHLYGQNDREKILEITKLVAELAPNVENRPYSVIDAGWSPGGIEEGPYDQGNEKFGDMSIIASEMKDLGVRPGLWVRPLAAAPDHPAEWRLSRNSAYLDPTHPEVRAYVRKTMETIVDWGFDLIKHDFTSWDITGNWGFEMGPRITADGWGFHDPTKTTAEIVNDLYNDIRESAIEVILIGCNTFSHLSAGMFELNRIGDDTSGRDWERTRKMGINTLAFRAAHHGTFYAADADVAAITAQHPWEQGSEWLKLLAQSGTPLFVSFDPSELRSVQWTALRDAFEWAASPQPLAEPIDWMNSTTPRRWRLRDQKVQFEWLTREGADPFAS